MAADGIILTDAPTPQMDLRGEVGRLVKANIHQLLVDCLADKLGHAYAVASGMTNFREVFTREMGAFWGNNRAEADQVADTCWRFINKAWQDQYPGLSAFAFLDAVHVPSEQSEKEREEEIEDAWEVTIASDEASMNKSYVGSARTRKGRDIFSTFWNREPQKPQ